MSDPEHPYTDTGLHKKLEQIHSDMKGEFKTIHDRSDREVGERAHGLQRIYQAIIDMEQRWRNWWHNP